MKKGLKWLILVITVLASIVAGLYFSVWQFSESNIENTAENRIERTFPADELDTEGWEERDSVYYAVDDNPTIELRLNSPIEINNLLIEGTIYAEVVSVPVYYTDVEDKPFDEWEQIEAQVAIKNNNTYLEIDRSAIALRIGLSDAVGCEMALDAITVNPRNLNVHLQMLALTLFLPILLVWFLVELICEKAAFKKMFLSLKSYRSLLWDLVSRDIKTKYRRSVLGILWSILNPLLMMLVLTAIFSNVFRFDINDFPVYYLTGYVLFNFVSESTTFSMTSIINSAGLIKKVYIPKIIFPLQKCLFSLVNLLFSLIAAVIVFLIIGVEPSWTMLLFWVPIVYLFIFNFGFSLILTTLNTFFRDVGYLYGVLLTVWMYLTPIIYPITILPGWMQAIVKLNPLYYYVEYFRSVTLYGTLPSLAENLICPAFSLIFLLVGILVFQKHQNKFIFHI